MGNNHVNRRNHVANAYDEDIFVKVISDKDSQSIRDEVKVLMKGVNLGRQNNRELGLFASCLFPEFVQTEPNKYAFVIERKFMFWP